MYLVLNVISFDSDLTFLIQNFERHVLKVLWKQSNLSQIESLHSCDICFWHEDTCGVLVWLLVGQALFLLELLQDSHLLQLIVVVLSLTSLAEKVVY